MSEAKKSIPNGWENPPLGDVLEIWDTLRDPVNAKERATRSGDFPYFGANGQAGTIDDFLFDGDYVLLAEDGGNFDDPQKGVAYRVSGRFWVNNHAHVLKPVCEMDTLFVVHALNSMNWMPFVSGTTRLKLNQAKMKSAPFPLPPLAEQRRIVAKIEALHERSRKAREALAEVGPLLGKFRQNLLATAFRGDLTADWRTAHPNIESATKLLNRIRQERRQKWEEAELAKFKERRQVPPKDWQDKYKAPESVDPTELPQLPADWCWVSLDELATSMRSGNSATSIKTETDWPILRSSAVRTGVIDYSDVNFMPSDEPRNSPNILSEGDLMVTRLSGSLEYVGLCAIVGNLDGKRIQYPDRLFRLRLVPGICDQFVMLAFQCKSLRVSLETAAKSSAGHQRISLSDLRSFLIPFPPLIEQQEIVALVTKSIDATNSVKEEVRIAESTHSQLEQSILAKAFHGELVPQDPNDEPASALLDRINEARKSSAAVRRKPATSRSGKVS